MFSDQTLTPKEATRLCALGTLALEPMRYGELAVSLRHFVSRVIGPTTEIMGHSIELLKYEGLAEPVEGDGDDALLRLTPDGVAQMRHLLTANVRAASSELNKLVIALKFRFLHLLPPEEQLAQIEMLLDASERELSRLRDLRDSYSDDEGFLTAWLNHDIKLVEQRLAWLADFERGLVPVG